VATDKDFMTFWRWFTKGSGGKAGFKRLINLWMLFHVGVGWGLSRLVPLELASAANAVLLPLVGILIGLAFAWAGNAQALMQSTEIDELAEHHEGGFVDYVYTYQLAILVILVTIVLWALAGLEVYDKVWPTAWCWNYYFGVKTLHVCNVKPDTARMLACGVGSPIHVAGAEKNQENETKSWRMNQGGVSTRMEQCQPMIVDIDRMLVERYHFTLRSFTSSSTTISTAAWGRN
jgi:hypothetical protein